MKREILQFIIENEEKISEKWIYKMDEVGEKKEYQVISEKMYITTSREYINLLLNNISQDLDDLSTVLHDFANRIIRFGWPLIYVTEGLTVFKNTIFELMSVQKDDTLKLKLQSDLDNWLKPVQDEIIKTYTGSWEHTVSMQKIALQELAAPLIPVFEGISVMPLVGTIDTERARQIMENLLQGVVKHRAEVVLIDITGVPVVDTMVAQHIIQAAEAVRLVGANCLLVGIRPEIAQTIVNLGINLDQIITKNSLKKGMEAALEMTNRTIVNVGDRH
ncbi:MULTISPECIES: STAS domain-containing protein [Sutcliffiella]|uniref:STAS domain-containing protein n=1 Tax=Sutcliffiella TaxID=2837511 RepID=UPI0022DD3805|nr:MULTISPECIES: STAS domain-containing protein [Sutcliffiella]MED4017336.1 STAS domain-containing protein [Sutcliffiella cohnii]WBL15343.1 STAS domain-containing protein [Sutcliffiella sp. NC1]